MPLITREQKGSKLTIQEMDGNLIYLNNNPLLLGKITADLNLEPITGNPIMLTDCMDSLGVLFQVGETITFYISGSETVYGTADVVNVSVSLSKEVACRGINDLQYVVELDNLDFSLETIPPTLFAEGNTSGATTIPSSINIGVYGPSQAITLNTNGSVFKINEIILTNINGTPFLSTICSVRTDVNDGGNLVASLAGGGGKVGMKGGVSSLTENNQWISMGLATDDLGLYSTVGNTLYFSADTAAGTPCTVDVYVFGYTLS